MNEQIIIELLILIAAVYLAFFKSYLTEKGKQAALKSDLDEITDTVESIKNEFIKEQELLKTDLQRILNNEVSYRSEERDAILKFHGTISEWKYSMLALNYGTYGKSNIESLKTLRENISQYYSKSGIAKAKVELLIEYEELSNLSNKLYLEMLNFHHWVDAELMHLGFNLENQKSLTDQFLIIYKDYERNKELANEMEEYDKKLKSARNALVENYMTQRNHEFFKVNPTEEEFMKSVKKYLKN
jgi:hypothetical protein